MAFHTKFCKPIIDVIGIKAFGIHPKNIFNYRYKFFVDNVNENSIVLDIGCGIGLISYKVSFKARKVIGFDYSSSNLKICRERFSRKNITFFQADIFKIDYTRLRKETGFNVVILSHILEHINEAPDLLRKLNTETVLICVPSQENWYTQLLKHLKLPYMKDPTHFREYTMNMLVKEIKNAGYHPDYLGYNSEGEIICKASKSD
ncbi:MAG: class I SAM-dependent methyltransferase [Candidatus Odinarchaeota archaeon]